MKNQHPEFHSEEQQLDNTIREMKQIIADLDNDIDVRLHKIGQARSIKDEVSAFVHSLMKSDHAAKIHDIQQALPSPYFGRVDFKEDEAGQFETFYIGRTKITRLDIKSAQDILVFDWRDPVSAIFYECQNGRATYEVLGRYSYTGEVRLKRQFKIEDGQLLAISDDDILGKLIGRQQESLIADPFLKERLLEGAGDKLKDIVTSIRSEQNQIIREPLNQVTIIQGVAGSGKSTIGLHRLSYLLYNEKLNPSRLAVIAPNKIFLDYIADLLPDLDVQGAKQLTFADIAALALQAKLRLTREHSTDATKFAQWKGSPELRQVLQAYLERKLEKFCLKLNDIVLFDGKLTITREQQLEKVIEGAQIPFNERLRTLEKYIRFLAANFIEVLKARNARGDRGSSDELIVRYLKESEQFLSSHFTRWPLLDPFSGYAEALADKPAWKSFNRAAANLEQLKAHTLPLLRSGFIEREDLAPLCHLKYLIDGFGHLEKYDHIVVDEGQDLNPLEYLVLSLCSRNTSFTIMGDMFQGIQPEQGLESWRSLQTDVFADAKTHYFELNYSYRSAKEIVDLFNRVLPEGRSKAIPVYEIGRKPVLEKIAAGADGISRLADVIQEFKQLGCKSIGIITRSARDSEYISQELHTACQLTDLHLIEESAVSFQGGVTIAPITLAKGLEFDGVILWNAGENQFRANHADAKLLYVALSRAMYYLHIFYQNRLTPLLR